MSIVKGIEYLLYSDEDTDYLEVWVAEMVARFLIELTEKAKQNGIPVHPAHIEKLRTLQSSLEKDRDSNPFDRVRIDKCLEISQHLLVLAEMVGYNHIRDIHQVQIVLKKCHKSDSNAKVGEFRGIIRHLLQQMLFIPMG